VDVMRTARCGRHTPPRALLEAGAFSATRRLQLSGHARTYEITLRNWNATDTPGGDDSGWRLIVKGDRDRERR
jgi:hypothetical protein